MKRSQFVKNCLFVGLAGTSIIAIMESCSPIYYASNNILGRIITIKKSEFIEVKKETSKQRPFIVVKNDNFPFPICVYSHAENEFVALSLICTHQGCELNPNEYTLTCPCHGSEFSNKGKVLEAPAEKDLEQFVVTSDEQNIYVELK